MASGAPQQQVGLTEAYVRAQLDSAAARRALPTVLFVGPTGSEEEVLLKFAVIS